MDTSWHVLGDQITQEVDLGPGNQGLVEYKVVPYMIDSGPAAGTVHQVKIPVNRFTPDNVRGLIQASVDVTHTVAGLSAGTAPGM
jgi:hypothetical protein